MAKFNSLIVLNAYEDKASSNNPSQNNFKWARELNGMPAENPSSLSFTLAPGESRTLFSGSRTLLQDNTTEYSISQVSGQTNTYQLTWSSGTAPQFRTPRISGADASTQITVTLNGPIATFASTGGTPLNLISGGVVVGDFVRIGNLFNILNQGEWQIISLTSTSFTVTNLTATAEGPITLGSGFASQLDIYSAVGVQVGDTLDITGGFSPVTQGSYKITNVSDSFVQFFSSAILPIEGPITTEAINIYFEAKRLIYLESDQYASMTINGVAGNQIMPLIDCAGNRKASAFLRTSIVYSLSIMNESESTANLFFAAIE